MEVEALEVEALDIEPELLGVEAELKLLEDDVQEDCVLLMILLDFHGILINLLSKFREDNRCSYYESITQTLT